MTAISEEERIRRWRASLAEELDSDDEDLGGFEPHSAKLSVVRAELDDEDMGLDLAEPPVSSFAVPHRQTRGPPAAMVKGSGDISAEAREHILEQKLRAVEQRLHEKELELEHARVASPEAPTGTGGATDTVRYAKVREIVKRSKAAMMALGRERAKVAHLEKELAALAARPAAAGGAAASSGVAAGSGAAACAAARLEGASTQVREARDGAQARERECRELKAQAASLNAKLLEQKAGNQALKAELKGYQRALARELGEQVAPARIKELLEESGGAKGRAQQIALLKEQVRELK